MNFLKRNNRVLIAVFFTFIGLYVRFKKLAGRELWCDELFQLSYAAGHFRPVWRKAMTACETYFPGDYIITYPFVKFFGDNKWLINIPHYIATILVFYFLYRICEKHIKTYFGFIVAFLILCFNQNLIFHSFEFRPYAVLPMLSLASFYFAEIVVFEWGGLSMFKKFLIGCFFLFVVGYHAYGAMIAVLCLLYFLTVKARESSYREAITAIRPFLLSVGVMGLLLFIWYASGTPVNKKYCQDRGIGTFDYYPNPVISLSDFSRFFRQISFNLMGQKHYGEKYLALGIWIAFLLPQKDRLKQIGFFLLMIVLPIQLILFSDLYAGYWFLDRQFVWVMSLYAFFLGWCWDVIFIYTKKRFKRALA